MNKGAGSAMLSAHCYDQPTADICMPKWTLPHAGVLTACHVGMQINHCVCMNSLLWCPKGCLVLSGNLVMCNGDLES